MARSCYVHIPFCAKICSYCDFYRMLHEPEWERRYVEAIKTEIGLCMTNFGEKPVELDTLYFGGGTPTILSEESWRQIFSTLGEYFGFSSDAEITSEANPESSTSEKLVILKELGVNRISFGAQSFDAKNLNRLGRLHNADQVGIAIENARAAGFSNLSLDLMYGLPDETDESYLNDLACAVSLRPSHISMYSLMLEGNVPLRYQVQRGEVPLPADDIVATRYERGIEFLAKSGYLQYEISNFSLEGFECRHNKAYWTMQDYFAFGPAAVGTLNHTRVKNEPDINGYVRNLSRGKLPPHDAEDVTPQKRLLETIMLSLRLSSGLDAHLLRDSFRYDVKKARGKLLDSLEESGDLQMENGFIRLTTKGMFRSDLIAASLCPDFV